MKNLYKMSRTLLIIFSLLYCFSGSISAYSLRQFINKDGLSNSAIQSLCQDRQGILWIGTCDGLNVFDGNNIQLYQPVNISRNLLSGNIISQIVESEPGILWLQTNYGLDRLDTRRQSSQTFTQFKDNVFLAHSNNCILVMKDDGCLYQYLPEAQEYRQLDIPPMEFNKVLAMAIDSHNLLWIFAAGNDTHCYQLIQNGKGVTLTPEKAMKNHQLRHAFVGEDAAYFIDETCALYEYNFGNRQPHYIADLKEEMKERGEVSSIIKRGNDFYIGFKSSGLIILKYETSQKVKYSTEYTEIQSGIFCLMKDKFQDIVWVATDGDGLYMLYNDAFSITNTLLNTPVYQINNPVRALYLDPHRTLWIGTKGSGILRMPDYRPGHTPENQERLTTGNSALTDNSVYCFAPGSNARLWIGTENGINYYSYYTRRLEELEVQADGIKVKYVHSINQINDTILWVSTVGEGIVKVVLENRGAMSIVKYAKRILVNNGHMASNYFFTSYREDDSTLWFGNRGYGTYRLDTRTEQMNAFCFNNTVNSQTANDVFAIHKNGLGYWLGTGSGLLHFRQAKDQKPDSISAKLYTNGTVHSILEDNLGNLWISTNQGLIRLNPKEQTGQTYNNSNGLAVSEFSDGAFYKDNATETLFFGGVNGFVTVRPDEFANAEEYMPRINLEGLSIFGTACNLYDFMQQQEGETVLQFDYKHNFFQLDFLATDYINGNDYIYSYRLKEASDQWIENGTSPHAIFSNLSPGEYTLLIKYRNNINGKESQPQAFTIRITPPWYLSNWAYTVYFLSAVLFCIGIALYTVHTYRLKRQRMMKKMEQQKKEEVYESKLRFFTNITHEFCTPLTLIQGPCEKILAHEGADNYIRRYGKMIQQNVEKLNGLIIELLEFRRLETGNKVLSIQSQPVSEKLKDIAESFGDMAENRKMDYQLEIEPDLTWNTDLNCFNKIAGNLLSNAFKYAPGKGSIRVGLHQENGQLVLQIANTGKGITPENLGTIFDRYKILDSVEMNGKNSRNGLGLAICKSMVTLLDGQIEIKSTPGEWTTFTVSLPPLTPNGLEVPQTTYEVSAPVAVTEAVPSPTATTEAFDKEKQTVMVIDDDPSMLWFVSEIFTEKYNVLPFNNARKALESLQQRQPDLIISDVMMPDTDGLSFASTLKQNKLWSHIPLILLSALHHEDDQVKGLESGADVYVTKPFNVKYLEKVAYRLIRREKDLKEYYNSAFSTFTLKEGNCLHKEEQDFLEKMIEVIEKNLSNPELQVELLSQEMGYSSRQFYRKLKPLTDKSPADIIKECRLTTAERLLIAGNLTIEELMDRTGFTNRSTFYKAFSQRYGMPPRQYKEHQKQVVKKEQNDRSMQTDDSPND